MKYLGKHSPLESRLSQQPQNKQTTFTVKDQNEMKGHTTWPNRENPTYKVTMSELRIAGIILTYLTENCQPGWFWFHDNSW